MLATHGISEKHAREGMILSSFNLVWVAKFPTCSSPTAGRRPISMDDSSMFIQWAMDTLQHEHPAATTAAYTVVHGAKELRSSELHNGPGPREGASQDGRQQGATHSWSSGDSVGSVNYLPMSWPFTSATAQPSIHAEATPTAPTRAQQMPDMDIQRTRSAASRKRRVKSAANMLEPPCVEEHVMAERKRREKINRRFIELSSVIPGLKKMDKATILSDAVRYVKEQQEKLKELEEDRNARSIESAVLVKKRPCIATTTSSSLPEIEARILDSESNVMVRIHCQDGKGVLVRCLAEVEGLRLSITHANVIPFPDCTVNITILAKVDEGFNMAAEDIVGKLIAVLHRLHNGKNIEKDQ